MASPVFRKGPPPIAVPLPSGTWLAKYDGTCQLCTARVTAGVTAVKWDEDDTHIICAHHRTQPTPEWTL